MLCTAPLEDQMPCCDGCPVVKSKAQCDAEAAARTECTGTGFAPCPAILCAFPGQPSCFQGTCVEGEGIEM